ncbi:hypothetical protein BU204_30460 [Actinophytocola xanthii]|uniref:Uncharacterized protein n=1 Tax=Actinophytocola xanthii TaxID=1912961 RepID=A0A1Q8CAG5_9PSEU|nr:hypothetical protein BU204_30460 [Actinophytocola xanthii]
MVAMLTVPIAVPAPAASADTAEALGRCRNDQWFENSMSFELQGTNPNWFPAEISTMRPGNVVRIVATGSVHYGGFLGSAGEWGPDGNGHLVDPGDTAWNYPGASQYSVAAWWNPTATLVRHNTCFVIPNGGAGPRMFLVGINDIWDAFGDNRGAYRVGVRVYCANTGCA